LVKFVGWGTPQILLLVLMRLLFENWEERNNFLAKKFIIRKWYMKDKILKREMMH